MSLVQNLQKIKIVMQYAQIVELQRDSTYGIIESPQGTKRKVSQAVNSSNQSSYARDKTHIKTVNYL